MVLPLWRSLHSLNLMLPKEERRAMLLRIFNDTTPVNNPSHKFKGNKAKKDTPVDTPMDTPVETPAESTAGAEDNALKNENLQLGEDEQEFVESRETYNKADDEEDRFNTTV